MKEQNFDLYGDPIPKKCSNPMKMAYCPKKHKDDNGQRTGEEHGLVKWTSHWSNRRQKQIYECSVCHNERSKKKNQKEKEQNGKIPEKVKQSMFANQISKNLPCPDCGKTSDRILEYQSGGRKHVWNIDHIDTDGPSTSDNLRVICQWCNKKKGNKKTHVVNTTGGVLDV